MRSLLANASCGNMSVCHVTSFGQLGHVRSYSVFRTTLGMTELPGQTSSKQHDILPLIASQQTAIRTCAHPWRLLLQLHIHGDIIFYNISLPFTLPLTRSHPLQKWKMCHRTTATSADQYVEGYDRCWCYQSGFSGWYVLPHSQHFK